MNKPYSNKVNPLVVYFIRCGDFVKIGASNNPQRRIKDLESSNPYPLELLALDEDEEFWHLVFNHRSYKGEWYYMPVGNKCEI